MRSTFGQFRNSRIVDVLGRCKNDTPYLMDLVNEAIHRLILEDEDGGFINLIDRMVFTVTSNYITAPREVARITDVTVCSTPVNIRNQFYEFLFAGDGLQPTNTCETNNGITQAIDRGTQPYMGTLPTSNQYLRAYPTDTRDVGKKVFIAGLDQNGLVIRDLDGSTWNYGFYLTLASPFVTSTFIVTSIANISKDVTYGDVVLYAVDATTGVETLLSRFAADETTPSYRRYYINNLPTACCNNITPVQVTGLAKLEYVPVTKDTDFLLIGNLFALKEECLAIKYGEMETAGALALSDRHHRAAIRLLNKELKHYEGKEPAIEVAIHGTAHLANHGVGTLL